MSRLISFFDPAAARAARDASIAQVDQAAPVVWKARAMDALVSVAHSHQTFTSDEVWEVLDLQGVEPPPEPRAMGAVFRQAQSEGLIAVTDRTKVSQRPACHCRRLQVWQTRVTS